MREHIELSHRRMIGFPVSLAVSIPVSRIIGHLTKSWNSALVGHPERNAMAVPRRPPHRSQKTGRAARLVRTCHFVLRDTLQLALHVPAPFLAQNNGECPARFASSLNASAHFDPPNAAPTRKDASRNKRDPRQVGGSLPNNCATNLKRAWCGNGLARVAHNRC